MRLLLLSFSIFLMAIPSPIRGASFCAEFFLGNAKQEALFAAGTSARLQARDRLERLLTHLKDELRIRNYNGPNGSLNWKVDNLTNPEVLRFHSGTETLRNTQTLFDINLLLEGILNRWQKKDDYHSEIIAWRIEKDEKVAKFFSKNIEDALRIYQRERRNTWRSRATRAGIGAAVGLSLVAAAEIINHFAIRTLMDYHRVWDVLQGNPIFEACRTHYFQDSPPFNQMAIAGMVSGAFLLFPWLDRRTLEPKDIPESSIRVLRKLEQESSYYREFGPNGGLVQLLRVTGADEHLFLIFNQEHFGEEMGVTVVLVPRPFLSAEF